MSTVDHYRLLGVPRYASAGMIRQAYVAKMKQHHPDRVGDGANQLTIASALGEAYACLSDPQARAVYDSSQIAAVERRLQARHTWRLRIRAERSRYGRGRLRSHGTHGRDVFGLVLLVAVMATALAVQKLHQRDRVQSGQYLVTVKAHAAAHRATDQFIRENADRSVEQVRAVLVADSGVQARAGLYRPAVNRQLISAAVPRANARKIRARERVRSHQRRKWLLQHSHARNRRMRS